MTVQSSQTQTRETSRGPQVWGVLKDACTGSSSWNRCNEDGLTSADRQDGTRFDTSHHRFDRGRTKACHGTHWWYAVGCAGPLGRGVGGVGGAAVVGGDRHARSGPDETRCRRLPRECGSKAGLLTALALAAACFLGHGPTGPRRLSVDVTGPDQRFTSRWLSGHPSAPCVCRGGPSPGAVAGVVALLRLIVVMVAVRYRRPPASGRHAHQG